MSTAGFHNSDSVCCVLCLFGVTDLTLTGCCDRPAQYTVHAVQLEPQASFGKHEFVKGIKISKDEKSQQQFSVMVSLPHVFQCTALHSTDLIQMTS